jgi:hypothetical protein
MYRFFQNSFQNQTFFCNGKETSDLQAVFLSPVRTAKSLGVNAPGLLRLKLLSFGKPVLKYFQNRSPICGVVKKTLVVSLIRFRLSDGPADRVYRKNIVEKAAY